MYFRGAPTGFTLNDQRPIAVAEFHPRVIMLCRRTVDLRALPYTASFFILRSLAVCANDDEIILPRSGRHAPNEEAKAIVREIAASMKIVRAPPVCPRFTSPH